MTLQDKIEYAYNSKQLFFKPWVGNNYEEGLLLKGDNRRRKVLIIGASRYCKRSLVKETKRCSQADNCIGVVRHDKLSSIIMPCDVVRSLNEKGELFDINQDSILTHILGTTPEESYKRFEKGFRKSLDDESQDTLWENVAFINYLQCMIDTIYTPSRSSTKAQFDESKVIVEKIISLLNPDIIILWGSATINRNMRITSKKEASCSRLFSNCTRIDDSIFEIKIDNVTYPLMLANCHPYYYKFRIDDTGFVEYLKLQERAQDT